MKVVSVLNYKGGVGKTTLTACLAQALALTGFRTLVIDNDGQHNLSLMLGAYRFKPNIRDVYQSTLGIGSRNLVNAIRQTMVAGLHLIGSTNELRNRDIRDPYLLKKCLAYCKLEDSYDYILIDNPPGMDNLQESSIHASDEIFVPTELSNFALSGIREMNEVLSTKFPNDCSISKIIPNYYKDTKQHKSYIVALNKLFPGKTTQTSIPFDNVFDCLVVERKVLFLHRLCSKATAYYMKLMHELFGLDEDSTCKMILQKRSKHRSIEARKRFFEQQSARKKAGEARMRTLPPFH